MRGAAKAAHDERAAEKRLRRALVALGLTVQKLKELPKAAPEKVWNGLLDPAMTRVYWMHENVSDWKPGSRWEHKRTDPEGTPDIVGEVVEFDPPTRLVLTWVPPAEQRHPNTVGEPTTWLYCEGELTEQSALDAIQVHGANGYSNEFPVERYLRNAKAAVIYEGTSQLHTLIQADYALGYREDRALRCEPWPAQGFSRPA